MQFLETGLLEPGVGDFAVVDLHVHGGFPCPDRFLGTLLHPIGVLSHVFSMGCGDRQRQKGDERDDDLRPEKDDFKIVPWMRLLLQQNVVPFGKQKQEDREYRGDDRICQDRDQDPFPMGKFFYPAAPRPDLGLRHLPPSLVVPSSVARAHGRAVCRAMALASAWGP